jgi:hypothetical protein
LPAGSFGAGANAGNVPLPEPNARSRDVARDRDDDVGRPVTIGPELADRVLGQQPDTGLIAADLAAERAVPEHRLLEEDLAVLGRVVEVAPDLLDDDLPLALDLKRREGGPDDELAEHVHATRRFAQRRAYPVDRRLAIRGGVERAANTFDGLGDGPGRRIGGRALEGDVLHEVGHAGVFERLQA